MDESCLDLNETSKTHDVRHISTMPRQRTQKGLGGVKGRKLSQPNSNGKTQSESKKSLNLSSSNNNENNDIQVNRKSLSSIRQGSTSNNIGNTKGRSENFAIREKSLSRNIAYMYAFIHICSACFYYFTLANGTSQGSSQNYHTKYSSLTLEREKVRFYVT